MINIGGVALTSREAPVVEDYGFLGWVLVFCLGVGVEGSVAEVGLLADGADISSLVAVLPAPTVPLLVIQLGLVVPGSL